MPDTRYIDLACPHCCWASVCGPQATEDWLRRLGMLRRNTEPSLEEMHELLIAVAGRLTCPDCGTVGLERFHRGSSAI